MKAIYTAEATAGGGRHDGYVRSSDKKVDMRILPPVELGGPDEPATNPEQLFAAGYASCFNNSVILVARRMKLDAEDSEVTAKVDLGVAEKGRFDLGVRLEVKVPKLEREDAERLIETAHKVCPYSRATRDNIGVEVVLVD